MIVCGKCQFFLWVNGTEYSKQLGQCRRYPPQFMTDNKSFENEDRTKTAGDALKYLYCISAWPVVNLELFGCGEGKEATDGATT